MSFPVLLSPRLSPNELPRRPMWERAQRPLHLWSHHPRLRPKQQHLLYNRLEKFPEICGMAPSLLKIPCIPPQLFRAFAKFPATAGQS